MSTSALSGSLVPTPNSLPSGEKVSARLFLIGSERSLPVAISQSRTGRPKTLLLAPATIVPAFPVENRYLAECAGKTFDNYVEWLAIVYAITLTYCPALSLPCGFTASGLPVGLQIVAPPRGEAQLLAGAKMLEDILGLRDSTPIDPRAPK